MNSRNNWGSNPISSNVSRKKSRQGWVFFLVLLGVTGYILYDNQQELLAHYQAGEYHEMTELIVLLFPVLFLFISVKKFIARRRYGDCYLTINPFPAVIGQPFAGTIEVKEDISHLELTAELRLNKKEWDYSDEDKRYTTHLVYKLPVAVTHERAVIGMRLLLRVDIPEDKPATSQGAVDDKYQWVLRISSKNKSFKRKWHIPVVEA